MPHPMSHPVQPIEPIDLSRLKTRSIASRESLVKVEHFARAWNPGGTFADFLDGLPRILTGNDIRTVISAIARASRDNAAVVLGM
ncbi:MAG: hypothetical protein GY859_01820, partial [Desulfobacterales bacterium]|nr:hypothetical protein [Desulfobacterales bacterium]